MDGPRAPDHRDPRQDRGGAQEGEGALSAPPEADSDGYVEGQRDRALVLDLLVAQHVHNRLDGFDGHSAYALDPKAGVKAGTDLVFEGLAFVDDDHLAPTPAGLVAHAAAQCALGDIAARIDAA